MVTKVVSFGWSVVGRRRVCIGPAMDLSALAVGEEVEGSQTVFVVYCWEACRVVVRVGFHMTIVLAVPVVALRSTTAEACLAY